MQKLTTLEKVSNRIDALSAYCYDQNVDVPDISFENLSTVTPPAPYCRSSRNGTQLFSGETKTHRGAGKGDCCRKARMDTHWDRPHAQPYHPYC